MVLSSAISMKQWKWKLGSIGWKVIGSEEVEIEWVTIWKKWVWRKYMKWSIEGDMGWSRGFTNIGGFLMCLRIFSHISHQNKPWIRYPFYLTRNAGLWYRFLYNCSNSYHVGHYETFSHCLYKTKHYQNKSREFDSRCHFKMRLSYNYTEKKKSSQTCRIFSANMKII